MQLIYTGTLAFASFGAATVRERPGGFFDGGFVFYHTRVILNGIVTSARGERLKTTKWEVL